MRPWLKDLIKLGLFVTTVGSSVSTMILCFFTGAWFFGVYIGVTLFTAGMAGRRWALDSLEKK